METDAVELRTESIAKIGPGDEVIVPSMTWVFYSRSGSNGRSQALYFSGIQTQDGLL